MPPLESFSHTQTQGQTLPPQLLAPPVSVLKTLDNSREESREPESKGAQQYDIAGAPMEGLYEATHLSALRSRTGERGPPTQQRLKKNIGSDLVGQGVISLEEAERMLSLYVLFPPSRLFQAVLYAFTWPSV
jgi:hypothetical protein